MRRSMLALVLMLSVLLSASLACANETENGNPRVQTDEATGIATREVTFNGSLTSLGKASSVEVSFQWGRSPDSLANETTVEVRTSTGAFSSEVNWLSAGTTYYFRAKAVGNDVVYGAERSFTTSQEASEIVLTLDEIGNFWNQLCSEDVTSSKSGSQSAHKVCFWSVQQATYVEITAAVYPSVDVAEEACLEDVPTDIFSVEYPDIGDECTYYQKRSGGVVIIFRVKNVVVWVFGNPADPGYFCSRRVEAKLI